MFEIITIIALIIGPTLAVIVGLYIDYRREVKRRKWEIFRNLMCFRKHPLSQGFVGSLNLIEVEFHDDNEVLEAWSQLFQNLCEEEPSEERRKKNFYDKREKLQVTLLQKVANSLRIKIDRLEILQSGYYPRGWWNNESEELLMRRLLGEFLSGDRPLPMHITNWPDNQPNPIKRIPAPENLQTQNKKN